METLTSLKNPKVASWRSLKDKKGREEQRAFLVEGARMVGEALSSSFTVRALLMRADYMPDFPLPEDVPAYLLPDHVFQSVCDTKTPQGIAAVLDLAAKPASGPRLVALDGVQDPGNVGTILRTADAAGLDGLLLGPDCADVFSPKVLRASMGSIFRMGLSFPENLAACLAGLRSEGYSVLSSQLDGEPFDRRGDVGDRWILVVGNEGNGISPAVRAEATHRLRLPMPLP